MARLFDPVADYGCGNPVLLANVGGGDELLQHLPHYGLLLLGIENSARAGLSAKTYRVNMKLGWVGQTSGGEQCHSLQVRSHVFTVVNVETSIEPNNRPGAAMLPCCTKLRHNGRLNLNRTQSHTKN